MQVFNAYENLLLSTRLSEDGNPPDRSFNEEFTSDKTRVVFSNPFRRLQQKAQVFSLETNSAVRSRLTHSLEVATIGISLAEKITDKLSNKGLIHPNRIPAFIKIVENACLIHDLGNPPFGHFAEEAIKKWFEKKWQKAFMEATGVKSHEIPTCTFQKECLSDFLDFDGNPQALRIVTTLQDIKLPRSGDLFTNCGLNLTISQIAAIIKYPCSGNGIQKSEPLYKKAGFFKSEQSKVEHIWSILGISSRFPLTYIMEAADDITYCISDIEDGIEKHIFDSRYFFEKLIEECKDMNPTSKYLQKIEGKKSKEDFYEFKIHLIREIELHAVERYLECHDQILKGELSELIDKNSDEGKMLASLKLMSRKYLFRSREAENKELAGYHALYGILDKYECLLSLDTEKFQNLMLAKTDLNKILGFGMDFEWRLFNRLPERYLDAYRFEYDRLSTQGYTPDVQKQWEWFYRAHLITDYLSSMTDHYVLETYSLLYGIKL